MQHDRDDSHARDELARAIRTLKQSSELTKTPTFAQIEDARESGILWVLCNDSDELPAALTLVASLADRNDTYEMWRRAVQLAWPHTSSVWLKALRGYRFRLGVEVSVALYGHWFSLCKRLVGDTDDEEMDDGDDDAPRVADTTTRHIPVRLVVNDSMNRLALIRQMRQLVCIQVSRAAASGFRIVEIVAAHLHEKWSSTSINIAQMIAADGVLVRPIFMNSSQCSLEDAAHCIPSMQRYLLDNEDEPTPSEDNVRATTSAVVAISWDTDDQALDGIFSGVIASSTVRKIIVEQHHDTPGNRERLWQWLGVVFFSDRYNKGVQELELKSCRLRMSEVVELERILQQSDPVTTLFSTEPSLKKSWFDCHLASASQFRLTEPCAGEDYRTRILSSISLDTPASNLVIVGSTDAWLKVFLPGWGLAWVARSDATIYAKPEAQKPLKHTASLKLKLSNIGEEDSHAMRALFHVVGRFIRGLTLDDCRLSNKTLKCFLRECPMVERLEILGVDSTAIQTISDVYESGRLHAKQIGLLLRASEAQTHASAFFKCLADKSHRLAQCLNELHLVYEPSPCVADLHEPVLNMLANNRTLHDLYILQCLPRDTGRRPDPAEDTNPDEAIAIDEGGLPEEVEEEAVYPDGEVEAYHPDGSVEAKLNEADGQFAVDRRVLAFLSLSSSDQVARDDQPAIRSLDSHSLSVIFSFFDFRTRCVHVEL